MVCDRPPPLDGVRKRELDGPESGFVEAMVRAREGVGKILKKPEGRVGWVTQN